MSVQCLLVDDSRIVRSVTRKILEPLGFGIREAEDGAVALEKCREAMPDMIVLDWNMPVMDGLTFLMQLRMMEKGRHPKVIFCTTENDTKAIAQALECGADEYIMKPFDQEILLSKLNQLGLYEG